MPLPLAFGDPGAKKKPKALFSITEEGNESDDDADDVLAILRSRSKNKTPDTSRSEVLSYESKTRNEDISPSSGRKNGLAPSATNSALDRISDNELHEINQTIKKILECQHKQQSDAKAAKQANDSRITSNEEGLSHIQQAIASTGRHVEDVSKSVKVLAKSISNDLKIIADEIKASNSEHRESLQSMKLSAESERNSLQAQIGNERILFEKEIEMLCKKKEAFEADEHNIFIEKERLASERTKLERSVALFEQRKIAAREEIENADKTMSMIREAETRLRDEMESLIQLSEFVKKKDAEAQEKLTRAQELWGNLREMDSSIKDDSENAERQRQEISENRLSLARDRVRLLKERSRERESQELSKDVSLLRGLSMALTNDFEVMHPSLRMPLASIKDELNKLRQE